MQDQDIGLSKHNNTPLLPDSLERSSREDIANDLTSASSINTSTVVCSDDGYQTLKRSLIQYHCVRIGYNNCLNSSKEYQLTSVVIFHYYDKNSDELLSVGELDAVEDREELGPCHVTDLVLQFDHDNDSSLSLTEFKIAMDVPTVSIAEDLVIFHSTVAAGSGLELKCDIHGANSVVWIRNGLALDDSFNTQFSTYQDGSLYIHEVALHHAGNYTCQDPRWIDVVQTHSVNVLTVPVVRVNPSTQVHSTGSSATLQCYAIGRPAPSVEWQLNELPIDSSSWRYLLLDDNRTLVIQQLSYPSDTGAYKCRAQNEAGSSQDIATVFVEQSDLPQPRSNSDDTDPYQAFVVFHDDGYTIYEPTRCHGYRHIAADFSLPTQPLHNGRWTMSLPTWRRLCPYSPGDVTRCVWGAAVNVRNKFIYASQPELNRMVVIDIRDHHSPVELIDTDLRPVEVYYVESLDQLIIVCGGQSKNTASDDGSRVLAVIRQASDDKRHNVVHVWPVDGLQIPGSVRELFLLPSNEMSQYGFLNRAYATSYGQQQLVKLDLKSLKFTKLIDLSSFNCQPISATSIAVGGRLIIQCVSPTGNNSCIIVDYVTDHVLSCPVQMIGDIYVSPDAKTLAVVHNSQTILTIYSLDEYGWPPQMSYAMNVGVELSDVRFVTSSSEESTSNYDIIATAANQDAVIYVELDTGRLSIVDGADWYVSAAETPWTDSYRHGRYLMPSGAFGSQLMTRGISGNTVTVVDSHERQVQCSWKNVSHPVAAVWIEPLRL